MIEEIKDLISNVGFPIVVALFVLIRMEKKIDKLISVLEGVLKK